MIIIVRISVFTCDPKHFDLTEEMKQAYEDDGYIFIKWAQFAAYFHLYVVPLS